MPDYDSALREIKSPEAPSVVVEAARARAAAVAERRRARRTRVLVGLSLGAAALIGAGFSPPGRAATGWLADVAGIGESPTRGQDETAIVIGTGEDPEGNGYEAIIHRISGERFGREDEGVCFRLDFPAYKLNAGGESCHFAGVGGGGPTDPVYDELEVGTLVPRPQAGDSAAPVLWGLAESQIARIEVVFRGGGLTQNVAMNQMRVTGELRDQIGSLEDFSVFVGFPPAQSFVERFPSPEESFEIEISGFDSAGSVVAENVIQHPDPRFLRFMDRDQQTAAKACLSRRRMLESGEVGGEQFETSPWCDVANDRGRFGPYAGRPYEESQP